MVPLCQPPATVLLAEDGDGAVDFEERRILHPWGTVGLLLHLMLAMSFLVGEPIM